MNGASFDLIAHELLKQKYILEKLLEENRELRRQLAQLRAGHGIFVEIGGQRIALNLLLEDAAPATPVKRPAPAAQLTPAPAIAPITPAPQTEESADFSQPTDPRIPAVPKATAAP